MLVPLPFWSPYGWRLLAWRMEPWLSVLAQLIGWMYGVLRLDDVLAASSQRWTLQRVAVLMASFSGKNVTY